MFTRQHLSVFVVCTGLLTGSGLLLNAEEPASTIPTAADLYMQGMDKFDTGELDMARSIFKKIDPLELKKDQRVRMYNVLKQLSGVEAEKAEVKIEATKVEKAEVEAPVVEEVKALTAAEKLAAADAEANAAKAAAQYEAILADDGADALVKAKADARLAQINRQKKASINDANSLIEKAEAAFAAGNLEEAKQFAEAANAGGDLGWFESKHLRSLVRAVESQQAAAAEAAAKAEEAKLAKAAEAAAAEAAAEKAEAKKLAEAEAAKKALAEAEAAKAEAAAKEAAAKEATEKALAEAKAKFEDELAKTNAANAEKIAEAVAATKAEFAKNAEEAEAARATRTADLMKDARLAAAKRHTVNAKKAKADGNYDLALKHMQYALQLDPSNADYANEIKLITSLAAQKAAPTSVLEVTKNVNELKSQQAKSRFKQYMNKATDSARQKDFPAARVAAVNAKTALDNARLVLTTDEYKDLRSKAELLAAKIEQAELQYSKIQMAADAQKQAKDQRIAKIKAERETRAKVESLIRRALNLRDEMKYEQALKLLDQALFLDPQNFMAKGFKDMIQDTKTLVEASNTLRKREVEFAKNQLSNIRVTVPTNKLITYPDDWPQLTDIRIRGLQDNGADSEDNARIRRKLAEPIQAEFKGWTFGRAIDEIHKRTGVDIWVNWNVLEIESIDSEKIVDLNMSSVTAEKALQLLLRSVSADSEFNPVSYTISDNMVTISTETDLQTETLIRTYDIRDLLVQVPNFTDAPSFDLGSAMNGGSGGSSGGSGDGLFDDEDDDEDEEDQLGRSDMIVMITDLIQNSVGKYEEWDANGGDISSLTELNGQLIVKSTPKNHADIMGLLRQLRETRAVQISVESRFLVVDTNFLEEVGVDLDLRINNIGGGFGPISMGQNSWNMATARSTSLTPKDFVAGKHNAKPAYPNQPVIPGIGLPVGEGFGDSLRGMTFGLSYIDDLEVNLLVSATQANQRSISLTAPRLTFFNGQHAWVMVGRESAYVGDLESQSEGVGYDPTIQYLQTGTMLEVEGTISADRRYVTLTVHPVLSRGQQPYKEVQMTTEGVIGQNAEGENGEKISATGTFFTPEVEVTEAKTTVSVPDRGTILLGGQRLVEEVEVEAGVPVLSKIPFLSRLFTNSSKVKDERTLLILIKPTIIIQNEEEENNFPGMNQSVADYNLHEKLLD